MAKYNLGGTVGESRVSSVILFGEQQSEAGGKKRSRKVQEKSESVKGGTKSMAGSKRSTNGKFEGATQFENSFFIKKGMMKDK